MNAMSRRVALRQAASGGVKVSAPQYLPTTPVCDDTSFTVRLLSYSHTRAKTPTPAIETSDRLGLQPLIVYTAITL